MIIILKVNITQQCLVFIYNFVYISVHHPNFSQNLRSPNTEALQEVGLNRAIADFPNQQSVVRF